MKNKNVLIILIIILMSLLISIFNFNRYSSKTLDKRIFNRDWYYYDYSTGYYDKLYLTENKVTFTIPNEKVNTQYSKCKNYSFDKRTNTIKLDCNLNLQIKEVTESYITLNMNNKIVKYFSNPDDALNYRFELYYGQNIVSYKKEKSQALNYININQNKLKELYNDNEFSKVVFLGNKCTSIDCTLFLDVLEHWLTKDNNIYYIDSDQLTTTTIKELNKLNSKFSDDLLSYNDVYPKIMIIGNKQVVDEYSVKCTGFNCEQYIKD